jgi:hypothetical protein
MGFGQPVRDATIKTAETHFTGTRMERIDRVKPVTCIRSLQTDDPERKNRGTALDCD